MIQLTFLLNSKNPILSTIVMITGKLISFRIETSIKIRVSMLIRLFMICNLLLSFTNNLKAATWSETNMGILYGSGFWGPTNLDEKNNVTTLTWEHASGWKYGDNFAFRYL